MRVRKNTTVSVRIVMPGQEAAELAGALTRVMSVLTPEQANALAHDHTLDRVVTLRNGLTEITREEKS